MWRHLREETRSTQARSGRPSASSSPALSFVFDLGGRQFGHNDRYTASDLRSRERRLPINARGVKDSSCNMVPREEQATLRSTGNFRQKSVPRLKTVLSPADSEEHLTPVGSPSGVPYSGIGTPSRSSSWVSWEYASFATAAPISNHQVKHSHRRLQSRGRDPRIDARLGLTLLIFWKSV